VGLNLAAFLAAVVVLAGADDRLRAQPPGAAPGAPGAGQPPVDPKLNAHLEAWAKQMGGLNNFHAKFELTRTDAVFRRERKYAGSILVMKPMFARLRLDSTTNKGDYEAFICNGKALYAYDGNAKTITEYPLNANPAAGGGNLMLDIVRGMTAQQALQRFDITLFKEDPNYVYLDIKPRQGADQQEFQQVRFALYGPNVKPPYTPYLPAEAWMMKPNQDTELWRFSDMQTNIGGIGPKEFEFVPIQGWDVKKAPAGPPPGPGAGPMGPGGGGAAGPGGGPLQPGKQ
ncbi:MAG TPA: TIGR03009 domain-containing protein, partial [Gemmataceae bacterium]|nr:TIGR03009 domain-containing protein [Gemmataceae bacterium]